MTNIDVEAIEDLKLRILRENPAGLFIEVPFKRVFEKEIVDWEKEGF